MTACACWPWIIGLGTAAVLAPVLIVLVRRRLLARAARPSTMDENPPR